MRRNAASEAQLRAAEPTASTWLSANAGSGKTRVLTDRVARLLLRGTEPHKILCLTYTKAAAAEMQNRLLERLGTWAMLPEEALRKELWLLGEEGEISAENLREARRLAVVLSTYPGRDWQMAHAVGLDALASTEALLGDLAAAGYIAEHAPLASALGVEKLVWPDKAETSTGAAKR